MLDVQPPVAARSRGKAPQASLARGRDHDAALEGAVRPGSSEAALAGLLEASVARRALQRASRDAEGARAPARSSRAGGRPGSTQARPSQRIERAALRHPLIQRNHESATLLKELATPKVFEGPAAALQTSVIARLEARIAEQVRSVDAHNARREELNLQLEPKDMVQDWRRANWDQSLLFIGGIELTRIPERDEDLVGASRLVDLAGDNALGRGLQAFDLAQAAGVEDDIVANTLRTMIAAKQIEYLRRSRLLEDGEWKIVIEVHYYRSRSQTGSFFHKDTLGQTLFVNLNYETAHEIAGPEYVVNPPAVRAHDEAVSATLPGEFLRDLAATRSSLPEPAEVHAPRIPARGVVAFVDEAIHHMTPLYGHRTITGAEFATFLKERDAAKFAGAEQAYDTYMSGWWPASTYGAESAKWFGWIAIARAAGEKFTRKELAAAQVPTDDIEALLARFGGKGFQTVSIPGVAGENPPVVREGRPPLKRRMSTLALGGQLPRKVTGDRRFFRTWVRAVRR